jgi:hypothetical protein
MDTSNAEIVKHDYGYRLPSMVLLEQQYERSQGIHRMQLDFDGGKLSPGGGFGF